MALTLAQQSALQTAITGDAALTTLNTANGFQQIADAMNLASVPAVSVWIPNMTTFVQNVTSIQAATITDYTTLSLQFQAT